MGNFADIAIALRRREDDALSVLETAKRNYDSIQTNEFYAAILEAALVVKKIRDEREKFHNNVVRCICYCENHM